MTDLADFLLARIADAEEVVRQYRQVWDEDESSPFHPYVIEKEGPYLSIDPAFVLTECDAKRRIVNLHSGAAPACAWTQDSSTTHDDEGEDTCDTMRALALPYAGHPDYREEWRP